MQKRLTSHLTTRVPVAHDDDTAGRILDSIKTNDFDDIRNIYIVDRQNRFAGYVGLHQLMKCNASDRVGKMKLFLHAVDKDLSEERAASYAIHHKIPVVPVKDKEGVFLGIISTQTIIETLRREHIEDIHKIAGIQKETALASQAVLEPPVRSVKHRLPWLLVGFGGSFLATVIMSRYENMLSRYIVFSFFIPGIVYLADAIGTQTETIVIRGLSLSWATFAKVLQKELITGFLIGLILGLLSLPAAAIGGFDFRISIVVCITIIIAGMAATSIGLLLPWLLHQFGKDPAFGSGPLATIIQDIFSILIYLAVARVVMG